MTSPRDTLNGPPRISENTARFASSYLGILRGLMWLGVVMLGALVLITVVTAAGYYVHPVAGFALAFVLIPACIAAMEVWL